MLDISNFLRANIVAVIVGSMATAFGLASFKKTVPGKLLFDKIILKRDLKAISVARLPHRLQTQRHALGVTKLATGTDFRASSHRIPCGLGPFD